MTWGRNENGIVGIGNEGCHKVGGLADGNLRTGLHLTGETVKLATVAVNGDERCHAIADILLQRFLKKLLREVEVTALDSQAIALVTFFQVSLNLGNRIHLHGKIPQNLVGNLILVIIGDVQGITDMLPEILNSLADIMEDIAPTAVIVIIFRCHTLKLCLKLLGSTLTAILRNDLLSKIVIICQLGISSLDELPSSSIALHH